MTSSPRWAVYKGSITRFQRRNSLQKPKKGSLGLLEHFYTSTAARGHRTRDTVTLGHPDTIRQAFARYPELARLVRDLHSKKSLAAPFISHLQLQILPALWGYCWVSSLSGSQSICLDLRHAPKTLFPTARQGFSDSVRPRQPRCRVSTATQQVGEEHRYAHLNHTQKTARLNAECRKSHPLALWALSMLDLSSRCGWIYGSSKSG